MSPYTPIFRSPITMPPAVGAGAADLLVNDLTGAPVILIQGDPGQTLQKYFGQVPAQPGQVIELETGFLARLTPGELYLFGKSAAASLPAADELERMVAAAAYSTQTTDLTHGTALIKLGGDSAASTLSKICGLDFHDQAFPNRQVKQTSAAKVKTLIARIDEAGRPTYHLHVERGLGQYFWETLWDAGQEFGLGIGAWFKLD